MNWRACAAAAVVLLGCPGEESPPIGVLTEVLVVIDAQPAIRTVSTDLRVRVFDHERSVVLDDTRAIEADTLPSVLPLVPRDGDAERTFLVEVTFLDAASAVTATARAEGRYVRGEVRELLLCLEDPCRGEACGVTEDCLDGGCLTCQVPPPALEGIEPRSCVTAAVATETRGAAPVMCPTPRCTPDPAPSPGSALVEARCFDGVDDDCDTFIDCDDPDCVGLACSDPDTGEVCDDVGDCNCPSVEDTDELCRDGVSNDCDAEIDCADADCNGRVCDAMLGLLCIDGACADCTGGEPGGERTCDDGVDNDCDSLTDCQDPDCCRRCNGQPCLNDGRHLCCNDVCVRIDRHPHCGSCRGECGLRSDGTRRPCVEIESAPPPTKWACRCYPANADSNCPGNRLCRERRGQILCQCTEGIHCAFSGNMQCMRAGLNNHNFCFPTPR